MVFNLILYYYYFNIKAVPYILCNRHNGRYSNCCVVSMILAMHMRNLLELNLCKLFLIISRFSYRDYVVSSSYTYTKIFG